MYPHERSLVKRLEGKPFALIGVNSDQDRNQLKQVLKKENISWRSFFAGPGGGQIAKQYQVQGWPTLLLLDARGVIRQKWLGAPSGQVMDDAIDEVLKDTPAEPEKVEVVKTPDKAPPAKDTPPAKPVDEVEKAEQDAARKLKLAKALEKDGLTDKAQSHFKEIISLYPKTKAAQEAQELLAKANK